MEYTLDPIVDLQQCRIGGLEGIPELTWRIHSLDLKPLQNNLDQMAKNMIEDSLTFFSNGSMLDYVNHEANRVLRGSDQCFK